MADGEIMFFVYNGYYARIQRFNYVRGVLRFAWCNNATIVFYDYSNTQAGYRLDSVSCEPITAEGLETMRNDIENLTEIDLVLESNKNTMISTNILGLLDY